jgi:DNA-binding NtrC family response regulator
MKAAILIIEHHADHLALLESVVHGDEVTVESVDNGQGALLRLSMHDYDCVLLGSPVPVDFGAESSTMLDLFDRLAPNLAPRLIVITAPAGVDIIRRALQMEVCAVFLPPFDAAELREVVGACIRGESPRRRLWGTTTEVERVLEG